jgi:hypothetical protein
MPDGHVFLKNTRENLGNKVNPGKTAPRSLFPRRQFTTVWHFDMNHHVLVNLHANQPSVLDPEIWVP